MQCISTKQQGLLLQAYTIWVLIFIWVSYKTKIGNFFADVLMLFNTMKKQFISFRQ